MKYNLSNILKAENAKVYFEKLLKKGAFIELKEIKGQRSNEQNRYIHLIYSWFAIEYGETVEHVKQVIFKQVVNPELFKTEYKNRINGEIRIDWKSTADLSTSEMTLAIERFRNYSSNNGIYIPAPNESEFLDHIKEEIEYNRQYI